LFTGLEPTILFSRPSLFDNAQKRRREQLMRNRVTDMRLFYEGSGFLEDSPACNLAGYLS